MPDYEADFWQDCANTFHEEQKQIVYAIRMGLLPNWNCAHPPTFDLGGRSVIDIGGGPVSLLLKCVNRGRSVIADPGTYPNWVRARYNECGIEYWQMRAEGMLEENEFDEAWLYNVTQHVDEPWTVIENAKKAAALVRLFEWIDIPAYDGHPHMLTKEGLEEWLGAAGFVTELNESGCVGRAFYGVFTSASAAKMSAG